MSVLIAGEWYPFNRVSGTFVPFYTDGSTLTESDTGLVFSTANGVTYNFTKASSNWCGMGTCLLVSSIKRPNGNIISYSYEVAFNRSGGWPAQRRLTQVIDSYGNGLNFSYVSPAGGTAGSTPTLAFTKKVTIASVAAFNSACNGNASEGCTTGTLPSVNYAYTDMSDSQPLRLDSVSKGGLTFNLTWSGQSLVSTALSGQSPAYTNTYVSGRVTEQLDQGGESGSSPEASLDRLPQKQKSLILPITRRHSIILRPGLALHRCRMQQTKSHHMSISIQGLSRRSHSPNKIRSNLPMTPEAT
ncbi:hypothetical protein ACFSUK_07365 [Sphingobium scionense]